MSSREIFPHPVGRVRQYDDTFDALPGGQALSGGSSSIYPDL